MTASEGCLRKQIKVSYLRLASLERTIARQRARIAVLKDGDANTSFFHRQCTYRRQKNMIMSLMVDGRVVTKQHDLVGAAFHHYDGLLGTDSERDFTLHLEQLIEPAHNRSLNQPTIWTTWRHLLETIKFGTR